MSFLSLNLAANVIGLFIDTKNVAVYDGTKEVLTGNAIFSSSVMSCDVMDDSKLMEHPIESGLVITDQKVFNPNEIYIRLSLPNYMYSSVYRELQKIYKESRKLRIKTKAQWYNNMVLQGLPHSEKPENYDRIIFDLHFKEVLIVYPQYITLPASQLKNAENSSTQKIGENLTNNTKKTSILAKGVQGIGGLF